MGLGEIFVFIAVYGAALFIAEKDLQNIVQKKPPSDAENLSSQNFRSR